MSAVVPWNARTMELGQSQRTLNGSHLEKRYYLCDYMLNPLKTHNKISQPCERVERDGMEMNGMKSESLPNSNSINSDGITVTSQVFY